MPRAGGDARWENGSDVVRMSFIPLYRNTFGIRDWWGGGVREDGGRVVDVWAGRSLLSLLLGRPMEQRQTRSKGQGEVLRWREQEDEDEGEKGTRCPLAGDAPVGASE